MEGQEPKKNTPRVYMRANDILIISTRSEKKNAKPKEILCRWLTFIVFIVWFIRYGKAPKNESRSDLDSHARSPFHVLRGALIHISVEMYAHVVYNNNIIIRVVTFFFPKKKKKKTTETLIKNSNERRAIVFRQFIILIARFQTNVSYDKLCVYNCN